MPRGYALVLADVPGTWHSQGRCAYHSPEEARAFADLVEWAGTQPWSAGKVGLSGSPTCRACSGSWPRWTRRTWARSTRGRAGTTPTARSPGTAASPRRRSGPTSGSGGAPAPPRSRTSSRDVRAPVVRRVLGQQDPRPRGGAGARVRRRRLGRPGPAPARHARGLPPAGLGGEVARRARRQEVGLLLRPGERRAAARLLRPPPARPRTRSRRLAPRAPRGARRLRGEHLAHRAAVATGGRRAPAPAPRRHRRVAGVVPPTGTGTASWDGLGSGWPHAGRRSP